MNLQSKAVTRTCIALYGIFIKEVFCTFREYFHSRSKLDIIDSKESIIGKMKSKIGVYCEQKEQQCMSPCEAVLIYAVFNLTWYPCCQALLMMILKGIHSSHILQNVGNIQVTCGFRCFFILLHLQACNHPTIFIYLLCFIHS